MRRHLSFPVAGSRLLQRYTIRRFLFSMNLFPLMRPFIHALPAERAHDLAVAALKKGVMPLPLTKEYPQLARSLFGLHFPSPIGMAAGFDKNAEAFPALLRAGFGFVEIGTVTPRPQPGNPKPRLFRLKEDEAVINRMGFNNDGMERVAERLERRDRAAGIVGVNIGKNKDSEDALADYLAGLKRLGKLADYVTVNISSPNTPGLRDLQRREHLMPLLDALNAAKGNTPLLVKIAPDLERGALEGIAQAVIESGTDGVIISNTTIERPASLRSAAKEEQGGLSGRPLLEPSTRILRDFSAITGGKIPLIGAGGIASAADARARLEAGASLVQLYTALVYQGLELVGLMKDELSGDT